MRVYVNNRLVELLPGMTVKHALINSGLFEEVQRGKKIYDEWDNEIGLDGELREGVRIFIKEAKEIKLEKCRRRKNE
jgi:hypothetical protein